MNATKLGKPVFGHAPEVLYTIDMVRASREFILAMMDAIVLLAAKVNEAIIGLESIGVDDRIYANAFLDNRHQLLYREVINNLRVHFTLPFNEPEYNRLSSGSAVSDTTYPAYSLKPSSASTSHWKISTEPVQRPL